jgi:hypothetical protein
LEKSICFGDNTIIGNPQAKGHNYSWTSNPSNGFISKVSNPGVNPKISTEYILTEKIISTGCVATDSVKVTVNPLPVPGVGISHGVCLGSFTMIGVAPVTGHSYTWTSNSSSKFSDTTADPLVNPQQLTVYYLTETIDSTGCRNSDSVKIWINAVPVPKPGNDLEICAGKSAYIGEAPTTGHSYSWTSRPQGFSSKNSSPSVQPEITTFYILTETIDGTGCQNSDSVQITVRPVPVSNWNLRYYGQRAYLFAKDSSLSQLSYKWYLGDGDSAFGYHAAHLYPKNQTYMVKLKVTDSFGCINESDSTINITISNINVNYRDPFLISIFPNPFQSFTTIHYSLINKSKIQIGIFDMTGKEVGKVLNGNQNPGQYQLDIIAEKYHLQPGLYLLKFMLDDTMISRQLIKF